MRQNTYNYKVNANALMPMKIYVTSDLHLEFGDLDIENQDDVEVLILSGDIMISQDLHNHRENFGYQTPINVSDLGHRQKKAQMFRDFLRRCSERFPHVVYVAGNHEFYHGKWPLGLDYLRQECAEFPNVYFMENDHRVIDGVTFVGSTLWTDMNRFDPLTLHGVADLMNDFQIIRNSDQGFRRLKPADVAEAHRLSVDYIRHMLAQQLTPRYVIVGHHAPSTASVHPRYRDDHIMNGAYRSDLSELILEHPRIRLWTHGHTHEDFDYQIGTTRVVCNPRGYIGYEARADAWRPKLVEI